MDDKRVRLVLKVVDYNTLRKLGLQQGAYRMEDVIESNCGWYTSDGKLLGYGDLSKKDMETVLSRLGGDELLVVVPQDGTFDQEGQPYETLNAVLLLVHARFIIGRNLIRYVPESPWEERMAPHMTLYQHTETKMPVISFFRDKLPELHHAWR